MFATLPLPEEARHDPDKRRVYLAALKEEYARRNRLSAERAEAESLANARAYANGAVANDGTGEMVLTLPALAWAHYKKHEHADLGSRADRKTLTKLHPQFAVKNRSAKIQVGHQPANQSDIPLPGSKFHKSYPSVPR